MSKFSVIKSIIDMEKFKEEILMFESEYNTAPYLLMNADTFDCLLKLPELSIRGTADQLNGCTSTYCGFKIFVSNDLKYGEIELR